jgi:hypothetical protein
MRTAGLLALGLFIAAPLSAQDSPPFDPAIDPQPEGAVGRHEVSKGSTWSIDDYDCLIDAGWDGDVGIVVNRHLDHHDLGIYDPAFKNVAPEKVITVRYGAAGKPAGRGEYEAFGHNDGKLKSYVIEADMPLLDAFATTNSLQFYRGKVLEIELDMTGFSDALAAMSACEATHPKGLDEAMPADEAMSAGGNTAEAAMDAANAAAEAVKP